MRKCRCGRPLTWRYERRQSFWGAASVPVVCCTFCGLSWPWVLRSAYHYGPWYTDRITPTLAELQASGDLILVREAPGRFEIVPILS